MIRRLCLVGLLAVMVSSLAFAAGAKQTPTTAGGLSQVRLTFYYPGERERDTDVVLREIESRIANRVNATLSFNWIPWGDYANRINVLTAAGDPYEAHFDADWFVWPTLVANDGLLDISEMLPVYAPKLAARYSPAELAAATANGKLTALPWLYPGTQRRAAIVREDLRRKYNVPEIASYADLEVYLRAIKANEPELIPLAFHPRDSLIMFADNYGYAMVHTGLQLVYKWDDPDMKIVPWEETPEFRDAIAMTNRWYRDGLLPRDVLTIDQPAQLFQAGRVGSLVHLWSSGFEHDLRVKAENPSWEARSHNLYPDKVAHLSPPMNNAIAFNANAANPERALMFLEWVQESQENYDLLMYGIENRHWVDLGPGRLGYPEGVSAANKPYGDWLGRWGYWNIELTRFAETLPANYREMYIADVNLNTRYWPHIGFIPNMDAVRTQVAQRQSIFDETGRALMFGVLDPSMADRYIRDQQSAGSARLVQEVQRQLDAWRASR